MAQPPPTDPGSHQPRAWPPTLLVVACVGLAAVSALSKSATYDERTNLGLGEGLLRTRSWDQRYGCDHPPLSFYFSALPSALPDCATLGLNQLNRARLAMLINAVVLLVLVYSWARELYGPSAGLVALALAGFSPNLLAHLPLVTPDGTLTCTLFAAAFVVWRYGRQPSWPRAAVAGVVVGLSLLAKFTALLLLPVWAAVGACAWWRLRARAVVGQVALAAALALFVLNAGYAFKGTGRRLAAATLRSAAMRRWAATPLGEAARLLPKPFVRGIDFQLTHAAQGEWGYLLGEHSKRGWRRYFLVAFAIKTPIALQALLVAALAFALRPAGRDRTLTALCVVVPPALLFAWMSLFNTIDIGLRYLLPALPFVHVGISRLAALEWRRPRVAHALLAGLVVAYAAESTAVFPHYLAFFNAWIGGPLHGYRWLADSNVDWGQDANLYRRYMVEHPDAVFKPGHRFVHGRVVVNVNALVGLSPEEARAYAWLRQFEPVGHLGYSYLIFDVPLSAVPRDEAGARGCAYLARLLRLRGQSARAAEEYRRAIECLPAGHPQRADLERRLRKVEGGRDR